MEIHELLIFLSSIVIFSFAFDNISSKIKLPSVVLLLLTGVLIRYFVNASDINIEKYEGTVNAILPILGTFGLIFIVLEGALELEINKSKIPLIKKSFLSALIILFITTGCLFLIFYFFLGNHLQASFINAIPLGVISSAIAIPSVKAFGKTAQEFIVYETSFSDILGVVLFNFALTNNEINLYSFGHLGYELILMVIISILATVLLGFLFEKLQQNKKFIFVLAILVFVYGIAKSLHLSALVLIFIFGVFAGNSNFFLKNVFKSKIEMNVLQRELHYFQSFVTEFAFVLRTFFFVVFGFSIKFGGVFSAQNLAYSGIIVGLIYLIRYSYLSITKSSENLLLWLIAPRGLITILLFYSIPDHLKLAEINQDIVLLVILMSIVVLSLGGIINKKPNTSEN